MPDTVPTVRRVRIRFREWTRRQVSRATFPLAVWLDRRHPEWCWASLCTDLGLAWDLRDWRANAQNTAACRSDCVTMGSCWCGKMATAECRAEREKVRDAEIPF